jgi:ribosomal protein L7Ae-like RNA K-turn-binding protein
LDSRKARFMISISMKAGKVAAGEFAAEQAIRAGSAELVIISEDASANTKKKFRDMSAYRSVPYTEFLPKSELGALIGKGDRSSVVITDANLAREIRTLLDVENGQE